MGKGVEVGQCHVRSPAGCAEASELYFVGHSGVRGGGHECF